MASKRAGEPDPWAAERNLRRTRLISVLVAVLSIVVFGYALANVTMRLERHIAATTQWKKDCRKLGMAYTGLSSAAAANDALAYDLLLRIAVDETASLQVDSIEMPVKGSPQRLEFMKKVQGCLFNSAAAFNSQTPDARAACHQLLAARGF